MSGETPDYDPAKETDTPEGDTHPSVLDDDQIEETRRVVEEEQEKLAREVEAEATPSSEELDREESQTTD